MLQLFLAQTTLIIHRRHLKQDIAFRQALSGEGENVRAAVNHQRHFIIREALTRLQAFLHQANV